MAGLTFNNMGTAEKLRFGNWNALKVMNTEEDHAKEMTEKQGYCIAKHRYRSNHAFDAADQTCSLGLSV